MVGQRPLEAFIGVRVPDRQQIMKEDNQEDFSKVKESVRKDHERAVEIYIRYYFELQKIDQGIFQLKLALGGLITAVFVLIFSNPDQLNLFSIIFKSGLLTLFVSAVLLLGEEFWKSMDKSVENYTSSNKDVILTNIRAHTYVKQHDPNYSTFLKLGAEAEILYNKDVAVLADIKSGMSVEEIIEKRNSKIYWKIRLLIWLTLAMCLPVLFSFELFFK